MYKDERGMKFSSRYKSFYDPAFFFSLLNYASRTFQIITLNYFFYFFCLFLLFFVILSFLLS